MTDTIPVAQLRAFVERIERIEADIKDLNGDKSEVYKELRGCGFDVKAVRAVVAKRKLDTADREERDAMFDLYWSALNGTGTEDATRVHVHGASYSEAKGRGDAVGKTDAIPFDPETGEITDNQKSGCSYSEASISAAASPASDESEQDDVGATASSTNSPETATEPPHHLEPTRGDGAAMASSHKEGATGRQPVDTLRAGRTGSETVTVVGDESGTLTNSHSQASSSQPANSVGEAPSSSPASPARHSDDDIPAFIKQDKPGCLKLKDGHCRLSFATSALCAECNQHRAMARALA